MSGWRHHSALLGRLAQDRAALAGSFLASGLVVAAFVGPLLLKAWLGYDYEAQDLAYGAQPPSALHWFGTDFFGRDLFTRVLYGLQISLTAGLVAALVAATIGTLIGATSGYLGGRADALMMRAVDVLYALPFLFVVIVLVSVFGRSLFLVLSALGLVGWLTTARVVRGQVLSLAQGPMVLAARAAGAGGPRILRRHLIPNILGPAIACFTLAVPAMILEEAFLSFLGLGVGAPRPSLGALISDGAAHMTAFWWELVFPSATLVLLLASLTFLGDGLRATIDPKS